MLSCAKGDVVAVSMMAMVRAPKPNTCSVQLASPSVRPNAGSDSTVVIIVSHSSTCATGRRVIASENSHMPSSASPAPICASMPWKASSKPSTSMVNQV